MTKTTALLAPKLGCAPGNATYDKLWYGVYVFYINAVKTIGLIAIALLLGILPYVIVFALTYGALRVYSFGIHLNNTFICTLLGLVYYLGGTYLSLYVVIPLVIKAALLLACAVCFIAFAPAQTKKRPIPERQRKPLKTKALMILAIVATLVFSIYSFHVYSNLLFIAAVCQTVNLLPITYKIFKEETR